jgi:hypothetical protein
MSKHRLNLAQGDAGVQQSMTPGMLQDVRMALCLANARFLGVQPSQQTNSGCYSGDT